MLPLDSSPPGDTNTYLMELQNLFLKPRRCLPNSVGVGGNTVITPGYPGNVFINKGGLSIDERTQSMNMYQNRV